MFLFKKVIQQILIDHQIVSQRHWVLEQLESCGVCIQPTKLSPKGRRERGKGTKNIHLKEVKYSNILDWEETLCGPSSSGEIHL